MIPDTKQLAAAYKSAPSVVQEFITSPELSAVFEEIRTEYQLHIDEAGALSNALNAVFLELVPLDTFPGLLKEAIKGDEAKHSAILKEINERVFTAFRKKLQEPSQPAATQEVAEPEVRIESKEAVLAAKPEDATGAHEEMSREVAVTAPVSTVPNPTPTLNKLEQTVREKPTDIEIATVASKPEQAAEQAQKPTYTGTDPYREPIE